MSEGTLYGSVVAARTMYSIYPKEDDVLLSDKEKDMIAVFGYGEADNIKEYLRIEVDREGIHLISGMTRETGDILIDIEPKYAPAFLLLMATYSFNMISGVFRLSKENFTEQKYNKLQKEVYDISAAQVMIGQGVTPFDLWSMVEKLYPILPYVDPYLSLWVLFGTTGYSLERIRWFVDRAASVVPMIESAGRTEEDSAP